VQNNENVKVANLIRTCLRALNWLIFMFSRSKKQFDRSNNFSFFAIWKKKIIFVSKYCTEIGQPNSSNLKLILKVSRITPLYGTKLRKLRKNTILI
jgi:hypothetical protein